MHEFVAGRLPVDAQLAGHLVEGSGELAEFVAAVDGEHLVEVAFAEFAGGLRQPLEGPQDDAAEPVGKVKPQRDRRGDGQEHDARGLAGGVPRPLVLLRHGALVDADDGRSRREQLAQGRVRVAPGGRGRLERAVCRRQERLVAQLQFVRRGLFTRFRDDGLLRPHVATAERRLFVHEGAGLRLGGVPCAISQEGLVDAQRMFAQIAHGRDARVVLVQRGVDGPSQTHEQPDGIAAHHHQQEDERRDAEQDAVA